MIPTVSKEIKHLIDRYQEQYPGELKDLDLRQLIFIVMRITKNLEMHKSYDGSESSAVDIVRRALFSKLNLAKLYKADERQ